MQIHGQQVAHIWANQHVNGETSAKGHSIYFEGPTIYSYGSHFPIARHVEHKGNRAVLMTTRSYGVTTGKHIGYVLASLDGLTHPIMIHNPMASHAEAKTAFEQDRAALVGDIASAKRAVPAKLRELGEVIHNANVYAEFFGLKWRLTMPDDFTAEIARMVERNKRKERAEFKRETERQEQERRQWAIAAAEWKRGERNHLSHQAGTFLRIDGDEIETSHGARVPVEHASKAFPIVKLCHDRGRSMTQYGQSDRIRLGHFAVDRIDADGTMHVGCHVIPYSEVERIAQQLGLVEGVAEPPSAVRILLNPKLTHPR